MSAERPELGAGRVFKVFGMAGEGLGSRDMSRQRSILWQERSSLRGCVARVGLALLTIGSSGKVSRLWAVVTTQESEGTISESNFKKVTLRKLLWINKLNTSLKICLRSCDNTEKTSKPIFFPSGNSCVKLWVTGLLAIFMLLVCPVSSLTCVLLALHDKFVPVTLGLWVSARCLPQPQE